MSRHRRTIRQIKTPGIETGGLFLRREALFLLGALLTALPGFLIRLLVLLIRLLPAATWLAALLVLLRALILIILGHSHSPIFSVKYCLNVIIQPTHSS